MLKKVDQKGFTLIEIIAVLVLLGILAAVAIPRFIGMQDKAREEGLRTLVSAAQSQLSMEYSRLLLQEGGDVSAVWRKLSSASAQDFCDKVSADGWLATDASLECEKGEDDDEIEITAIWKKNKNISASGTFTNPAGTEGTETANP